jgi:hypothetical protein
MLEPDANERNIASQLSVLSARYSGADLFLTEMSAEADAHGSSITFSKEEATEAVRTVRFKFDTSFTYLGRPSQQTFPDNCVLIVTSVL